MIPTADVQGLTHSAEAQALQDACVGKMCLEIGAWYGFTTISMARAAKFLMSVDWHKGGEGLGRADTFPTYVINLTRYKVQSKVAMIVGTSDEVLPRLEGFTFDTIFIDGAHAYENCQRDIDNSMKLLAADGTLVVHDYYPDRETAEGFGVTQAVNEALEKYNMEKTNQVGWMVFCRRR